MEQGNSIDDKPQPKEQVVDSPTFNAEKKVKKVKKALDSKSVEIEIPKKKGKGKKKKKIDTPVEEQIIEGESEPPKQEKKEKKKKHSKEKKGSKNGDKTPKFGLSPSKLEKVSNIITAVTSPTHFGEDPDAQRLVKSDAQILQPDNIMISTDDLLPNEKYNENIMLELNIVSYIKNKHVPIGNKMFYVAIMLVFGAGYIINFWDLTYYGATTCQDSYSSVAMYFNFVLLVLAKFGVFNYITSEMNASLTYDLKFPFLIPILATGVLANFQLPLIIYDYHICEVRSPLLQMSFGYFVIDIIAIVCILSFLTAIIVMVFFQKSKMSASSIKMIKTLLYFAGISVMIIMNTLFMFITFSQTTTLSLSLLIENINYWVLVVSGTIIFILRKKYNIQVFRALTDLDEEQLQKNKENNKDDDKTDDHTPHLHEIVVDGASAEVPAFAKSHRLEKPLEKIDEIEDENENESSKLQTRITMKKENDTIVPVTLQNNNFTVAHIPSVVNVDEQNSQRSKGA